MKVRRNAKGFTLVEILIVVVILGILAAIVIPQFTNASEAAKASNLLSQLQTIRSQLELYQIQHNGIYPDVVTTPSNDWSQMLQTTDVHGATEGSDFGPYLQQPPINPFTNSSAVATAAAAENVGWVYENGVLYANVPDEDTATRAGLTGNPNIRTPDGGG
jgi:general secretion pathway protein G